MSRAMEFLNERTVYDTNKTVTGSKVGKKKDFHYPLQTGLETVKASTFDSVRISSNPWIWLKADYRGGQRGKFSLRRCFPGFCILCY